MRRGVIKALGLILISSVAATASAAVAWSTPNGSTGTYAYSNGQSDNGLFGNPTVLANSFIFFPSNFVATASNGGAQTTSDTLSFDITVNTGQTVTAVAVRELGDYSILGNGSVSATGDLIVTDLITTGNTVAPLISTPGSPILTGSGSWTAQATATNLPNGWTTFHVSLTNILQANAGATSTSTIQKKFAQAGLEVSIIVPEPASVGVLVTACSGLIVLRRRR